MLAMFEKIKKYMIFLVGFIAGMIVFGLINASSYSAFLNSLRLNFRADQNFLAIKATQNNDVIDEVVHRKNIVDSFSKNSVTIFDDASEEYGFWTPFQLIILDKLSSSMDSAKGAMVAEGLERGKLAYALEKAGLTLNAGSEWNLARELSGYDNKPDDFKQLIIKLINTEISTINTLGRAEE
jgi:hypothetical protein